MYSESAELIKQRVRELKEPENFFDGVRLPDSFALPDNILLFYHDFSAPAPVAHHRYTLVFPLARMHYCIDQQEFDIAEGDLLFIPPYARRFLKLQSAGYQRFFITFDLPSAQNYLPETYLNRLSDEAPFYLKKLFDLFPEGDPEELSLALYGFLTALSPGSSQVPPLRMSREIGAAVEFINENLHTQLTNCTIAVKVNMSTSNLARRFRNEMGIPLHKYIAGQRLEFARYYLQKTCMNTEEIARCCGFLSGSSFAHFFTSQMGISPLAYRKAHHS